jgi:hypothetical protein
VTLAVDNATAKASANRTIHFIDGEKGGVGKSLFSRVIVQWFLDQGRPFYPVDTDRSNPTLFHTYKGITQRAFFSENKQLESNADAIFQLATERSVVVDLAAQSFRPLSKWIERNELLKIRHDYGIGMVNWFVCSGGVDSVNLFKITVKHFEGKIPHVLVRNLYMRDRWEAVEQEPEMRSLLEKYQIPIVDLPQLNYAERDFTEQYRITFAEARDSSKLTILERGRINIFLRETYRSIEKTGLMG